MSLLTDQLAATWQGQPIDVQVGDNLDVTWKWGLMTYRLRWHPAQTVTIRQMRHYASGVTNAEIDGAWVYLGTGTAQ